MPMLTISGAPGLVYLNGRLCGETGAAAMPLAPDGVQYLELRPFDMDSHGAVLRLTMEDGRLKDGVTGDVFAVQWPDGWISLEIRKEAANAPEADPVLLASIEMAGGRYLLVDEGGVPSFGRDAGEAFFLPVDGVGASTLRALPYPGLCAAEGNCANGRYAAILRADDAPEMLHCAVGPSVELDGMGTITNVEAAGDLVGHASVCVFAPDALGNYAMRSREPVWQDGAPRWPTSPGDTALAWLEALRYGAWEEAAGYLARPVAMRQLEQEIGQFDTVTEIPKDGSEGVHWGVLNMAGPNLARVRRLSFAMLRQPDAQGEWKIDSIEF